MGDKIKKRVGGMEKKKGTSEENRLIWDVDTKGTKSPTLLGIVGKLSAFLRVASVRDFGPHVWI
jgi:hypothetical protein